MTTKEKAEELVHKYDLFQTFLGEFSRDEAKQCALIAVDEILKALKITIGHCELRANDAIECVKDLGFWQEVKQEIERI